MTRTFVDAPAVREATPLLIGLIGPSHSGKTKSALRLAAGMQRVMGGEIFFIDTESRRALHYTKTVPFRHVPFGAPFSPADYHAAIDYCAGRGASILVIDSMSHEHEGPGGVLEMFDEEVERLAKGDDKRADKMKMLAWQKPKKMRRRLIQNAILQSPIKGFIFCFRAKEKLLIQKGKEPVDLGWMPIAGDDYVYEMTLNCLLLPAAEGVPTWTSEDVGSKLIIKVPEQFRGEPFKSLLHSQLSEDAGEALARWAAGDDTAQPATFDELAMQYAACSDGATYRALGEKVKASWKHLGKSERDKLSTLAKEAKARLATANAPETTEPKRTMREPGDDADD